MPNFEMPKNTTETASERLSKSVDRTRYILEGSKSPHKQHALEALKLVEQRIESEELTIESIDHIGSSVLVDNLMVESLPDVVDDPEIMQALAEDFQMVFRDISGGAWENAITKVAQKKPAKKKGWW